MELVRSQPFEVVEVADGRVYRLPPRELGELRWLGLIPAFVTTALGTMLVNCFSRRFTNGPLAELDWAMFALLALVFVSGAYRLLSLAAAIWFGRTEIEIRADGRVRATDRAGWFCVLWGKLNPGTVRRLVLKELFSSDDPAMRSPIKPAPRPQWNLLAETASGRKVWLAPGYSRAVVTALAQHLARYLTIHAPADIVPAEQIPEPVPVVVIEPPTRDVLEQPRASRVLLERHADGVTLVIPPEGVVRSAGLLLVGGALATGVGGWALVKLAGRVIQQNPVPLGNGLVVCVLLPFGFALILGAVHFGRRQSVLAVVGDRFFTLETSPFYSSRQQFTRDQLSDIACGPSNVSVNKKPLPQLQIVPTHGAHVGMLTGRETPELKWIATILRHALRLPNEPNAE